MEIRKDPILLRETIISSRRKDRPFRSKLCFFCPGNEKYTPKETYQVGPDDDWKIRVVPNKYPIWKYHEVIIESPRNVRDIHKEGLTQVRRVLDTYVKRYVHMSKHKGVRYVQIFKNKGKKAGASISHVHSQMVGLPSVPKAFMDEISAMRKYRKECAYCSLVKKEISSRRIVYKNENFLAYCPPASIYPYEVIVIPRKHVSRISDITSIDDWAVIHKKILIALYKGLGRIDMNMIIHQSPLKGYNDYHMHVSFRPKTKVMGGFEAGTGVNVSSIYPEKAAKELRAVLKDSV